MPSAVVTGGGGVLRPPLFDALIERAFPGISGDNLPTPAPPNLQHPPRAPFPVVYPRQQGVDTSIARIFNTYGARMRPNDGRAVPTFVRQALEGKPLTVFGDGTQTRSFCYVDDLIRGLIALADSGEHLPINLGNPNEFTMNELADAVIRITGSKSEIVHEALPVDDPQVRQPDITRARQLLGWEPEVQLEEGLRRMMGSFGREPVVA